MASLVLIRFGLVFVVMIKACQANQHLYTNSGHKWSNKVPADNGFDGVQSLSKVLIYEAHVALDPNTWINATPNILGADGSDVEWVTVTFGNPNPANTDWIAVFSPANFNASLCPDGLRSSDVPGICTAPIKYKYANYSNPNYASTGNASMSFRLINQRGDFSFALFSGDVYAPVLKAISNAIVFTNPKAPLHPRLAIGKSWNEMVVTWTSGYGLDEATPMLQWGPENQKNQFSSPAGTLSYTRDDMCRAPAKTIGWRDPGYIHTAFMKELWPNTKYYYKIGHRLHKSSDYVWGQEEHFVAAPYPGQNSIQRIIVLGDTGKGEIDGSNEYANYQPGALNTTARLEEDLDNYDVVVHVGDLSYSNGYISQWDQFNEQMKKITARNPFMVTSGNHERDSPDSGSFYANNDSGGECGVPAQTNYYFPANNPSHFWYSFDYGMFHFCVMNTELDWREGTRQYEFLESCLSSADRQKQPWLVFIGHRVLGYSSNSWYSLEGSFEEPMGRESLQNLWQKYKVDLALWGHVHNYERIYPTFQNVVVSKEKTHYSGIFNATIHMVVGGSGSHLNDFASVNTTWSAFKDLDFGFTKLTAFNHSTLLVEYKKSRDGKVYDHFWITRKPMDVLGCDSIQQFCFATTLAS